MPEKAASLSKSEIAAVVSELSPLRGAWLQRVWARGKASLVLRLRAAGKSHLLLICAEAPYTRLHLVSDRPRASLDAPPIQSVFRNEVEGLRLESIGQLGDDRIVELLLEGQRQRKIIAELMGRRGNILLLDEHGVILFSANPLRSRSHEASGHDEASKRGGPEKQQQGYGRSVMGLGLCYEPPRPYSHTEVPDRKSRFEATSRALEKGPFAVNRAVDALFSPLERELSLEKEKGRLARPVRASVSRTKRALSRIEQEAKRAGEAATLRRYGELLKAALHQIEKGSSEVRVIDWYEEGQPEARVPLRPDLSGKENMERYFRLARRLGKASARIEERRRELETRLSKAGRVLDALTSASDETSLEKARRLAMEEGFVSDEMEQESRESRGKTERQARRRPYRRYVSATGRTILVGRGSVDNDELTFKVARGNDVWLHVRGHPGSHVVISLAREEEPDEQTLLDAATLAAHFSSARGESVVDMAWTRRKHVRKPKGAPPGLVTVSQERGLMLRLEPDRLKRLLEGPAG